MTLEMGPLSESASIGEWEALGVELGRQLPVRALATLAQQVQHRLLERVCGPRWRPTRGVEAPFGCPRCGAGDDFARKGVRARLRRLDTACGTVRLRLANVCCRGCGRVFAPLLQLLGVAGGVRRTDRLTVTLAELATQVSYGRAATIADRVGGMPATAGRAHASLADVAGLLGDLPSAERNPDVVLLDGTGARAGADRLGVGVDLAVGLTGRQGPLRRRRARTCWLGATVGEEWDAMADRLAGVAPPALVLVDGEEAVTALARRVWPDTPAQRCWWHLPHGLVKAAYRDRQVHMPWARHLAGRLHGLLHDAFALDWDQHDALAAWDALLADVPASYATIRGYLAAARPHAFTFLDDRLQRRLAHLGGVDLGTGVVERVMRELNARTDIGGSRWSVDGLRDLVTVTTAQMLNHPQWQQLRKDILQPNTIGFDLTLKVNA